MKKKQSLYNKYRPTNFDQVIGQRIAKKILINSIVKNKINHAYLFYGIRGTGKTTLARIFAKAVNCETPVGFNPCDNCESCNSINNSSPQVVIEIDAASNNGVDEIRAIRENASYLSPIGQYKVYIIDEVHMLTKAAFNALLKTLEEPPENTIFLLATTEIQKIPDTVLSRTLIVNLEVMSNEDIKEGIEVILKGESVNYEPAALDYIAMISGGSLRDAISYTETALLNYDDLTTENVVISLGLINKDMIRDYIMNDQKKLLEEVSKTDKDPRKLSFLIMEVLMELIESGEYQLTEILNLLISYSNTIKDISLLRIAIKSCFLNKNVPHGTPLKEFVEEIVIEEKVEKVEFVEEEIVKEEEVEEIVYSPKKIDLKELNIITDYADVNNYIYIIKNNDSNAFSKAKGRWRFIDNYITTIDYKDIVLTLSRTEVLAATEKTIIIGFHNENQINEFKRISLTPRFFSLMREILGEYKFVLPVGQEAWSKLISVKDNIELQDIHTDLNINISDFVISDEDKKINAVNNLFGEENVTHEN